MKYYIEIYPIDDGWQWVVVDLDDETYALGSSPDYHQACECAQIAWEQHSKDET